MITNLFHLLEILYKTAHRQNFGPNDLLNWLKINIQKMIRMKMKCFKELKAMKMQSVLQPFTVARVYNIQLFLLQLWILNLELKPIKFIRSEMKRGI